MNTDIILTVPAQPDSVRLLRSLVGSVAADHDFTYEEVDDLRLAVDEACTHLLGLSNVVGPLTVTCRPSETGLEISVAVHAADGAADPGEGSEVSWTIMRALVDVVDSGTGPGGGPAISLSKQAGGKG